jgi:hypothetical protein
MGTTINTDIGRRELLLLFFSWEQTPSGGAGAADAHIPLKGKEWGEWGEKEGSRGEGKVCCVSPIFPLPLG